MADYSFAPSGGPRGFLGAYNFAIDSEKSLADMAQRKEEHDQRMLSDRLNYDIARKNEELLGDISRKSKLKDFEDKDELRIWDKQEKKAKVGQEVSKADVANRMLEMDMAQKRMDAMESAEAYLRSRGGDATGMLPAPSDIDGSYQQVREILRKGMWDDTDIDKYDKQGPQALVQWIQEGARAAKVDAPRLAERRKFLQQQAITSLSHPEKDQRPSPPTNVLGKYLEKPEWNEADKQAVRGLLSLEAAKMKESTFWMLMDMKNINKEDAWAAAEQSANERMRISFKPIYDRLGDTAPAAASTPSKPADTGKSTEKGTVKFDPKAKKGSQANPIPVSSPKDLPKTNDGNWYVDPRGGLHNRSGK